MAIFSYKCILCDNIQDKLIKYEESEHMQFCQCSPYKLSMVKIPSYGIVGLNFKGKWFKTSGEY